MPIIDDISYDKPDPERRVIFRFPVYRKDELKFGGSLKILGVVKRMFSGGNVVRPRKNNSGWTEAVGSHQLSNNVPIFHIGELPKNDTTLERHDYPKYHGSTASHQQHQQPGHGPQQHHAHGHAHHHHHDHHHHKTVQRRIIDEIENYCDKTTLHGLRYVGDPRLSFGERFFWFMSFAMAIGFAGYYISNVYEKWNKTPVIISFSPHDASLTDIPFPAITICNMNQAKKDEAMKIIDSGSNVEKKLLNDYCKMDNPINVTTEEPPPNWETVKRFLFKVGQGCADTLRICEWRLDPINCLEHFNNDLTDEGLCCSFNRLPPDHIYRKPAEISLLNATYASKVYDWTPEKGFKEVNADDINMIPRRPIGAGAHLGLTIVLDTQVDNYYCSSTSSVGFKIVLSNPIEAPKVADFGFLISPGVEARYGLVPSIREATEALRPIDIGKRQCYFSNERPLQYFRTYTAKSCHLECQSNYTWKVCGCVPYFLPKTIEMKICSKKDEFCMEVVRTAMEDFTQENWTCNCLSSCFDLSFEKVNSYAKLTTTVELRKKDLENISAEYYGKNIVVVHLFFMTSNFPILVKRELYGFTEFLSGCGGLLGLFLGFSFLSLIEAFYFLTIKILCYVIKAKHAHRKHRRRALKAGPHV